MRVTEPSNDIIRICLNPIFVSPGKGVTPREVISIPGVGMRSVLEKSRNFKVQITNNEMIDMTF